MAYVLINVVNSVSSSEFDEIITKCKNQGVRIISAGRELSAIAGYTDENTVENLSKIDGVVHIEKLSRHQLS